MQYLGDEEGTIGKRRRDRGWRRGWNTIVTPRHHNVLNDIKTTVNHNT